MNIRKEIKKESFAVKLIIEENGREIGWAYLYILKNDRHDEPYGFLENVYIEQEYRRHGFGSQLIETVIAEAKRLGCYKLIGTTRHTNPQAQKFYERFGFRDWGKEFRMDLLDSKPKQQD